MNARRFSVFLALVLLGAGLLHAQVTPANPRRARLGAELRSPSPQEGERLGLDDIARRWNGQVIQALEEGGPAAEAGLRVGDVVLALDDNRLYSLDDADDFLRAAPAGAKVVVHRKRRGSPDSAPIPVALRDSDAAPAATGVDWPFAGPGQLDEALAVARASGKRVLVGLSGAET